MQYGLKLQKEHIRIFETYLRCLMLMGALTCLLRFRISMRVEVRKPYYWISTLKQLITCVELRQQ